MTHVVIVHFDRLITGEDDVLAEGAAGKRKQYRKKKEVAYHSKGGVV